MDKLDKPLQGRRQLEEKEAANNSKDLQSQSVEDSLDI
jgi:hypothetical protein